METRPKTMMLGALSALKPEAKKAGTDSYLPKNKEIMESITKQVSTLGAREKKRSEVLQKTHHTLIHVSPGLKPIHDRLRARNKEVFGLIHYGHMIHVGISRIRSMTITDRLALIQQCTVPKEAGKQQLLCMTRGCFLDYQLFWIQVREELWNQDLTQIFGMPELIRMVDIVTAQITPDVLRREYVRISISKFN